MRFLLLFTILIHGCGACAHGYEFKILGDDNFKWVKPFDDKVKAALKWENEALANEFSDYLMYSLTIGPMGYALGQEERRWQKFSAVVAGQLAVAGMTHVTKAVSNRTRPNGKSDTSFFSGHTSSAFAGAASICNFEKELCTPALLAATATGYLRIAANKHWASDVIVGGAVGYAGGSYIPTLIVSF